MDYGSIIRANSLGVGWVADSPNSAFIQSDPELINPIFDESPSGRSGESWEIANAALFFVSDLSGFVTGQCLIVDGGQTLPQAGLNATMRKLVAMMRNEQVTVKQRGVTPERI